MYTYAGSSAAATQLTPLPAAPEVVDPGGLADQAIAVFKAQFPGTANQHHRSGEPDPPRVSDVIKTLSSPINGTAIDAWIVANTPLDDIVPLYTKYMSPYVNSLAAIIQSTQTVGQNSSGISGIANLLKPAAPAAAKAVEGAAQGAASAASGAGQAASGAAAGTSRAVSRVGWVKRRSVDCRCPQAGPRGAPPPTRG